MNAAEFKQLEGQRIQQVLGAIGALPAAMLVFGDGPDTSAAGAPLFAAAIALIIGSLMNWNYTDGAYYLDSASFKVPDTEAEALDQWQANLLRNAYRFQHRTYGYGVLSLLCSIFGVAGVYSTIRTGVSVDVGFVVAVVAAMIVSFDIVRLGMTRNSLLRECRRLSETAVA
jgi:hypothetical protein